MTTGQRFDLFLDNLKLTDAQKDDGATKRASVVGCLNWHYRSVTSGTTNSRYVGSWGKETRIRPPRDVDVLYTLPDEVYYRFEARTGNKQSQLLQEVKTVLLRQFPRTDIRGSGPVVLVGFGSYNVELVPAFTVAYSNQFQIPVTKNGGFYKRFDPLAEEATLAASSTQANNNTRPLTRMMKRWQDYCSVPMKSFWLELLAIEFLSQWQHRTNGSSFYDWMVRDYLRYVVGRANGYLTVPGTYESLPLGDGWKSRAETAYGRAVKACEYEAGGYTYAAGVEWQKIFGPDFPAG